MEPQRRRHGRSRHPERASAQLVQPLVAGLVVAEPDPTVAAMPVSEGMEKYRPAHPLGDEVPIVAAALNVTTSGLLACPLAATVSGVVSVWLLPETPVAKFHATRLVDELHVPLALVRALLVYPAAYVLLVGRLTPVMVTGNGLEFVMLMTTSPVLPG
jgi:hypothetical protein